MKSLIILCFISINLYSQDIKINYIIAQINLPENKDPVNDKLYIFSTNENRLTQLPFNRLDTCFSYLIIANNDYIIEYHYWNVGLVIKKVYLSTNGFDNPENFVVSLGFSKDQKSNSHEKFFTGVIYYSKKDATFKRLSPN